MSIACPSAPRPTNQLPEPASPRELRLDTYEDRVRGFRLGRLIGATYAAPAAAGFERAAFRGVRYEGLLPPAAAVRAADAAASEELCLDALWLRTLDERGPDLTPFDAGRALAAARFPAGEPAARSRALLRSGVLPPWTGHPVCNEDFGDIEYLQSAGTIGLVSPGLPAAVRRLSHTIGRVTSHGEGLHAGRLVAGMVSEAAVSGGPEDLRRMIEAGLAGIPADSACARLARDVIAWHDAPPGAWEPVWDRIEAAARPMPGAAPPPYPVCCGAAGHVNAAYVVLALLHGEGDPAKTARTAARCGRAARANAAAAGGVLGALLGARRLAGENKSFDAAFGSPPLALDDAVRMTVAVARRVIPAFGGSIGESGGATILRIPAEGRPTKAAQSREDRPGGDGAPPLDDVEDRALYDAERMRLHDLRAVPGGRAPGWTLHGDLSLPEAQINPGTGAGVELPFELTVVMPVRPVVHLLRQPGFGRVRFSLDGKPAGTLLDTGEGEPMAIAVDLGQQRLPAGRHVVKVDPLDGRPFGVFGLDLPLPPPKPLTRWRLSPAYAAEDDGRFDEVFPPEQSENPSTGDGWTAARAGTDGVVDVRAQRTPGDRAVAYAFTTLTAREAFDTRLLAGSDDGIKIWLNGRLVHAKHKHRGMAKQEDVIPVSFEKGANRLLLKIEQDVGDWKFVVKIEDPIARLAP